MHVKNAVYKEIKPGWKGITLPLKAGTPMNAAGQIVNGAGAIGIVPQTITVMPVMPTINLLVGGSVSLAEVNAAYGSALTKAAKESMNGIAFFGEDGTPEPDPIWKGETVPGTLPAVTSTDNGKTLVVTEGVWALGSGGGGGTGGGAFVATFNGQTMALDKTWNEIKTACLQNNIVIVKNVYEEEGEVAITIGSLHTIDGGNGHYSCVFSMPLEDNLGLWTFETDNENGYPAVNMG